jgi:hypothetical protein
MPEASAPAGPGRTASFLVIHAHYHQSGRAWNAYARLRLPLLALTLLLGLPALAQAGSASERQSLLPLVLEHASRGGYAHWTQGGHQPPFRRASQFYSYSGARTRAVIPRVLRAQMHEHRVGPGRRDEVRQLVVGDGFRGGSPPPGV